jgi:hypothetical protein
MTDFSNEIQKMIAASDPDRLNGYMDMFDRLLLYNLAVGTIPPETLDELIQKWEQTIKGMIDTESKHRTHFLESTPQGRLAKKHKQPDGEDLRLLFLTTLNTAKQIVTRNLQRTEDDFESDVPY